MTFLTEVNFPFLGTAKHRSNWSPLHEISQHFKMLENNVDIQTVVGTRGKQYRVWVDQNFPSRIYSDVWLVNFKQWEQTGEEQQGGETCSSLYAIYKG
ncbi:unnamed protein product [Lactuca virosa]|uniref:Sucrose-phosphatase C-terminal domain-containing protein n=1 Tax=Lactuca virosa TaxID=75947 RepID=A0AAU9MUD4_9ASTR|nr:unnamed protein product [Lactuca virosa]